MPDDTTSQQSQQEDNSWDLGSLFGGGGDETTLQENNTNDENQEKKEIPITDREEALTFAYGEMGKIMRNDGHKVELKLIGNINYRVGAWIRVFLPSFDEDCMMFITKAQQEASADSEWITSLTLVDYPPSLSKGEDNSSGGDSSGDSSGGGDAPNDSDGDGTPDEQDVDATSPLTASQLWTLLSVIVNKYYPASKDPNYWIGQLRDADTKWGSIAKVVNRMGGDKDKQDTVIREVLAAKKRLKEESGGSKVNNKKGYVKKSQAPQNTRNRGKAQKTETGYNKRLKSREL